MAQQFDEQVALLLRGKLGSARRDSFHPSAFPGSRPHCNRLSASLNQSSPFPACPRLASAAVSNASISSSDSSRRRLSNCSRVCRPNRRGTIGVLGVARSAGSLAKTPAKAGHSGFFKQVTQGNFYS